MQNDNALSYTWYTGVIAGERQRPEGDAFVGSPWRRWEVKWDGFAVSFWADWVVY